jgi:hypothetical protein
MGFDPPHPNPLPCGEREDTECAAPTCARRRLTRLRCTAACKFLLIPKITPVFTTRRLLPLATPRWLASPSRTALSCPHAEEPRASSAFTRDALWRGVSKHEGTRRPILRDGAIRVEDARERALGLPPQDEAAPTPDFDSRIRTTRSSCTAPCKEQAGNREPSSASFSYTRRLVFRSDQRADAPRAFRASPPRTRMGEGYAQGTPHPSSCVAAASSPLPQGERAQSQRPRLWSYFTCQTASLLRPRGAMSAPRLFILASPSPDRGVAERRETFGCSGTRSACHIATRQAPSEAPCVPGRSKIGCEITKRFQWLTLMVSQ